MKAHFMAHFSFLVIKRHMALKYGKNGRSALVLAKNPNITAAYSIEYMVKNLKNPRKIMLMVKEGDVVDIFIKKL